MKKKYIIALAIIFLVAVLIIPKMLKGKGNGVKFKVVKEEEIPEKIREMLPKYLMEERALTCKYRDEIYIVVTRGEKNTKGFKVELIEINKENHSDGGFELAIQVNFIDPDLNEIVEQEYDYPYIVVKTNLKEMPQEVHLDVTYNDGES